MTRCKCAMQYNTDPPQTVDELLDYFESMKAELDSVTETDIVRAKKGTLQDVVDITRMATVYMRQKKWILAPNKSSKPGGPDERTVQKPE